MKREGLTALENWAEIKDRKPLVIWGTRQVGKTYLIKEFGASNFPNYHYLNFEEDGQLSAIFEGDLKASRIVSDLKFALQREIDISRDLLIFDEIQACPRALTSLKYFRETLPEVAICAAGSLLGLNLSEGSFPVGSVEILRIHPLTFNEFLNGIGDKNGYDFLTTLDNKTEITPTIHRHLWQQLLIYLVVGGLPEAINAYRKNQENPYQAFIKVREVQQTLIRSYLADVAKHSGKVNSMHIERVFRGVPAQLAANLDSSVNRFKFSGVVPGVSQYSRLVGAIDWLNAAGLIIRIPQIQSISTPLISSVKENMFKLMVFDVGILGALANLQPATILDYDYGSYKGYFAENFVAQELLAASIGQFYSWREQTAEIEFVLEGTSGAVPIEVKSGSVTRSKSLKIYSEKYTPQKSAILSGKGILDLSAGRIPYHLPLYAAQAAAKEILAK